MNQNQKRILIAVIAVFVAMIAYPPFHVVGRFGAIFNMGYGWIFDPPRETATVNISMLLTQWIVVLVIGGIAFFLTKGSSVPPGSSPKQSSVAKPSIKKPKEKAENLYHAILGEENCIYYLTKFESFDQQGQGLKASWNWAAFFGFGLWALYRKIYGWFFACWGIVFLSTMLEKQGASVISAVVFTAPWIAFTIYANSLYHNNIKKKIAIAQLTVKDETKLLEHLHYRGGVQTWVIYSVLGLTILGIVAAIAIPFLAKQTSTVPPLLIWLVIATIIIIWAIWFLSSKRTISKLREKELDVDAVMERVLHEVDAQVAEEARRRATYPISEETQKDEEFIALLKSTVKENRLDIIPNEELFKICKRARSIAAFSNTLDIELSKAINTLSEEIKKRGLSQEKRP